MTSVGFIGLGTMGGPMALNIVKGGYKVKGFDIETEVKIVDKISSGHRSGYHAADYYKFYGMLNSPHETAIAMDSDMLVMSKAVRTLPYLAKKFGICLPINPRLLVNIDSTKGDDSNYDIQEDKSTFFVAFDSSVSSTIENNSLYVKRKIQNIW